MEGSKINKQKELQLIAEEIILQRRQNNVIEGSVLLPKDFSKADQSSNTRSDEINLKSRRQRKNSDFSRRQLGQLNDRYQSEVTGSQKRMSRRLSDQKTASKPKTLTDDNFLGQTPGRKFTNPKQDIYDIKIIENRSDEEVSGDEKDEEITETVPEKTFKSFKGQINTSPVNNDASHCNEQASLLKITTKDLKVTNHMMQSANQFQKHKSHFSSQQVGIYIKTEGNEEQDGQANEDQGDMFEQYVERLTKCVELPSFLMDIEQFNQITVPQIKNFKVNYDKEKKPEKPNVSQAARGFLLGDESGQSRWKRLILGVGALLIVLILLVIILIVLYQS